MQSAQFQQHICGMQFEVSARQFNAIQDIQFSWTTDVFKDMLYTKTQHKSNLTDRIPGKILTAEIWCSLPGIWSFGQCS